MYEAATSQPLFIIGYYNDNKLNRSRSENQRHPYFTKPNTLLVECIAAIRQASVEFVHVLTAERRNNNSNKHAYAGTNDCFTHPSVLLVLQAPRLWAQSS
jgi:hypothetical protein